jgi:hypothetical protein
VDLTPPAAAPAAAPVPSDNVSLDQLISEAVNSAPAEQTDSEQPSAAETADQNVEPAAASVEGTSTATAAEHPAAAEPAKEPDDAVSVRRARSILAEANKKERDARQAVVNAEQDLVKQLLANPRNFLAKHGKSIAELIDIDLGQEHDPNPEQPKATEAKDIAKLVAEQVKAALEQTRQEQQLASLREGVRNNIAKDTRFELINRSRSQDTDVEFMEEYYNTHGAAIPWDKAARLVEQDLRERFGPPATAPAAAPAKVPQRESTATSKPAAGNTTLTNNEIRSAGPPDDSEPTDPDQLIKWLVAKEEKRLAAQAQ